MNDIAAVLGNEFRYAIIGGHVIDVLRQMPDDSISMVWTSPPYFGLRDYGLPPVIWGGDPSCQHAWGSVLPGSKRGNSGTPTNKNNRGEKYARGNPRGRFCEKCGAWEGSLGLEPTPNLYIDHLVEVFREIRRVLHPTGVAFLNLGDSYWGDSPIRKKSQEAFSETWDPEQTASRGGLRRTAARLDDLKPKDLVGMPWATVFALRADGWWLRAEIIWAKDISFCPTYSGGVMPESVNSRPTRAHETIFMLAKSSDYYWDADAIREPHASSTFKRINQKSFDSQTGGDKDYGKGANPNRSARRAVENLRERLRTKTVEDPHIGGRRQPGEASAFHPLGRNVRDVWTVNPQPFPEAHFAVAPERLVTPCVLAGSSEKGVCAACGAPWQRVVKRRRLPKDAVDSGDRKALHGPTYSRHKRSIPGGQSLVGFEASAGWEPTCECEGKVVPSLILDPFCGAGTTGIVSLRNGRRFIGIDLSTDYVSMAQRRLEQITIPGRLFDA